jgi:hypothetical protein
MINLAVARWALPVTVALLAGACQTTPVADGGFLSSYEGLKTKDGTLRVAVRDRRDDALAA